MYLWKCWRDTRSLFIILFVIAAAITPGFGLLAPAPVMRDLGATTFFPAIFGLIGMIAALGFGSHGASEEFARPTLQFLYSKPRSRAYFLWIGWVVGAAELLAISVASILTGWITLAHYAALSSRAALFHSLLGRQTANEMMSFLYGYCLSYALTILLRGGVKGLGATIGIYLGCSAASTLFRMRWNIILPFPSMPIGKLPLLASDIVWVLVALLMISATQAITARTEI